MTTCLLRAFSSEPKILSVQILGGEASNQEYKISIVKSKNRFCQATLLPISGQFFFIPFQFRCQRGRRGEGVDGEPDFVWVKTRYMMYRI